jgi:hypothetical protein
MAVFSPFSTDAAHQVVAKAGMTAFTTTYSIFNQE